MDLNRVVLLSSTLLLSTTASANFEPGSYITDGGVELKPSLSIGLGYDDNLYYQPENEQNSEFLRITPKLQTLLDDGVNQYSLDLGIDSGYYRLDSADNFFDYNVKLASHNEFSSKQRLDLSVALDGKTEPRGTGLSEGTGALISEPVEYIDSTLSGTYEYGAKSSAARVAFGARFYDKRYKNFRAISQFRDLEKTRFSVTGFYNTQAGTDVFLELSSQDIEYDHLRGGTTDRDSSDYRAMLGMQWQASALTSGKIKLGYQKKDFDSSLRENFTGLSWLAGVTWKPLSYTKIELVTSQAAEDPLVEGDYVQATLYGVKWTHEWQELLRTNLSFNHVQDKYIGVARNEQTNTLHASLDYKSTMGVFSLYYELNDKNSSRPIYQYDKGVVGISLTLGLRR
ncbi:outer membrane beta-barrel protein [Pseudoalteromonas prydzensis]|uniref:outer membrane beta-barrel protein n=1 Tax=Pseudoalteromonas prydzensis TaxID=182141 RepID=UPI00142F327E|nr:outer membrane beta-barrel protein [Pseudoalteromonas prydzensis]